MTKNETLSEKNRQPRVGGHRREKSVRLNRQTPSVRSGVLKRKKVDTRNVGMVVGDGDCRSGRARQCHCLSLFYTIIMITGIK